MWRKGGETGVGGGRWVGGRHSGQSVSVSVKLGVWAESIWSCDLSLFAYTRMDGEISEDM